MTADSHHLADLDLGPNEASGLLRVQNPALLEHHGWDRGFWSVLDEVDVADCVALLGHRNGDVDQGWEIGHLQVTRHGDEGPADDAEALARHDGWVYLFGSQHGGKDGPIRRREQWVARFWEGDVRLSESPSVEATVVRTPYLLHRLINDALRASGIALVAMTHAMRKAYIEQTQQELAGTPDADRIRRDDWTINVEGAEFAADGTLLAGLRFPVTEDGRPVIVGMTGIDRLFDGGVPEATGVWSFDAVGRNGTLAGIRDLCRVDDTLHLVTGNLDSKGKASIILEEYPDGRETVNTHFSAELDGSATDRPATALREFPDYPKIEGIAEDGQGRFFYVSDEDETVRLRCTPLLSGPQGAPAEHFVRPGTRDRAGPSVPL